MVSIFGSNDTKHYRLVPRVISKWHLCIHTYCEMSKILISEKKELSLWQLKEDAYKQISNDQLTGQTSPDSYLYLTNSYVYTCVVTFTNLCISSTSFWQFDSPLQRGALTIWIQNKFWTDPKADLHKAICRRYFYWANLTENLDLDKFLDNFHCETLPLGTLV